MILVKNLLWKRLTKEEPRKKLVTVTFWGIYLQHLKLISYKMLFLWFLIKNIVIHKIDSIFQLSSSNCFDFSSPLCPFLSTTAECAPKTIKIGFNKKVNPRPRPDFFDGN